MDDRSADFMLEEYKQIANAYQDLHAQHNELVRFYLTLVAVPVSVLAVVAQVAASIVSGNGSALSSLVDVGIPVLLVVMLGLCVVGFMVVQALVTTRAEALLYVRTVNCVRRYFVERDPQGRLSRYLVLPSVDTFPPFHEGPGQRAFWNVSMVCALNAALFTATASVGISWLEPRWHPVALASELLGGPWGVAIGAGLLWFAAQWLVQRLLLARAEASYEVRFAAPYPSDWRIGIDLDGVLGDLAGAVITVAASEFGLDIKRDDITSHNLQECTDVNGAQVAAIFEKGEVFRIMQPVPRASASVKGLRASGWVVHIVTDRFWNPGDWSTAREWLAQHEIEWDHLNLVRAREKPEYASAHSLRFFVEDNHDTAVNLASVCQKVYLLDTLYNQGPLPANVVRLSCWQDVLADLTSTSGR